MKLAEALMLRADAQKRIEQLKARMVRNAKVQDGDAPAEDPKELLVEFERVSGELTTLIKQINKTNASTVFETDKTLTDALAERDALMSRRNTYNELAANATIVSHVYSKSEVRFKSTIDVAAVQRQADDLARQCRELDAKVQELNWKTELLD